MFTERFGRVLLALGVIGLLTVTAAGITQSAAPTATPVGLLGSIRGNGYPFYNFPVDTNLSAFPCSTRSLASRRSSST